MYKKKKRGQSLVEFALIAPFIFLILATIIEGSPLINAYIKVEKASNSGARQAAIYGQTDNDVLTVILQDLYKMSYKSKYDNFVEASDDTGGVSQVLFGTNCDGKASGVPYENFDETLYPEGDEGKLCYSQAKEQSGYGDYKTTVTIYPTLRYRINGSWATVSVLYKYRVYTPILFFVADILSDTDSSTVVYYKTVPIYKYSTKKVE